MSLSDYAVSLGLFTGFETVYAVCFGFFFCFDTVANLGCGSFGCRILWMLLPRFFGRRLFRPLIFSDADALLLTLLLFFERRCFLRTRLFPLTRILTGEVLTNFIHVP